MDNDKVRGARDIISNMSNNLARDMLLHSIKNDKTGGDILVSLRSAVVVSALTTNLTGAEKDSALTAISSEKSSLNAFIEDVATATTFINKYYKEQ